LAINTKERAEIWKEYFDKLLYKEETEKLIKIGNSEINEFEVEELNIVFVFYLYLFASFLIFLNEKLMVT